MNIDLDRAMKAEAQRDALLNLIDKLCNEFCNENRYDIAEETRKRIVEIEAGEILFQQFDKNDNNKCKCGSDAVSLHRCPYNVEIGDGTKMCNCCANCRYTCSLEV